MEEFFNNKYNNLKEVAYYFTRNKEKGEELLHHSIGEVLLQRTSGQMENIINKNAFVYFFSVMKFQYFNPKSSYNRTFNQQQLPFEDSIYNNDDEDSYDFKIDELNNEIRGIVSTLDWWEQAVWNMYYVPNDDYIEISGLTKEQTNQVRKISYRKLEKKMNKNGKNGIKFNTLNVIVNKINDKIRHQLKKNNIQYYE